MNILKRDQRSPYQKEWDALCKKEEKFLAGRKEKKETALNKLLAEKVPGKLQETLDKAFEKAFALIFDKGTGIIEKTYKKEEIEKSFKINLYTDEVRGTRKSLKSFGKNAGKAGAVNLALSGVSGVGMGLLGVGLPDIPVFTGMILKCVYEIALSFGFDYASEEERYFVLLLIVGAVGGAYDMIYMKQISEYAKLKYQKRFLMNYQLSEKLPSRFDRQ